MQSKAVTASYEILEVKATKLYNFGVITMGFLYLSRYAKKGRLRRSNRDEMAKNADKDEIICLLHSKLKGPVSNWQAKTYAILSSKTNSVCFDNFRNCVSEFM
jgi:hypothetical protein